jgi:eukaryotic-like serine/threonine-protein kinase
MQADDRIILREDAEIIEPNRFPDDDSCPQQEISVYLRIRGKTVTITPVMKEILEFCRTTHTVDEIVQWISEHQGCSCSSIYPAVTEFLKRMAKFGALIHNEDRTNKTTSILERIKQSKRIDGFILLEEVGKNSKVILYKCTMPRDSQTFYTIKILTRQGSRRSFLREFRILNNLPPHENIRKVITASEYYSTPYILLEYVDGEPMSHIIEELSLETRCRIAQQIMSAIDHLHRHGILHGDIHASNFLIDDYSHVHLIDLGMAYYEGEKEVSHGGIPWYMPPERMPEHNYLFSKHKGNYVSEVFQVGVCLYLLFSGEYPFHGKLLRDLRQSIQYNMPPPLTHTDTGEALPEPVSAIIFKSMEKDPAARYQSVAEMLQDWTVAMGKELDKRNVLIIS